MNLLAPPRLPARAVEVDGRTLRDSVGARRVGSRRRHPRVGRRTRSHHRCSRERPTRLTVVEIDPQLASSLRERMKNANVEVVEADATAMPFADGSFSAVLSKTGATVERPRSLEGRK